MPKVITDEKSVEEFLNRGIAEFFPGREEFKKMLKSGKKLRVYCGFDPTAPSLQFGNAVLIKKLGDFQKMGHQVIFLIGDFTGMIGDPTDKKATRKKLTQVEVQKNAVNFKKQAATYISFDGENPAELRNNSEWLKNLTFSDLLELTSNFTVGQMIQRDMFQERIKNEKPIHLHEFLYPVAQAYDSVVLDVDAEIGGNDQMFNMLRGRDLAKILKNKEKMVFTMKLLADDAGTKMGKSEGNAVYLWEEPEAMYGQIMAWPDGVIANSFELLTDMPISQIEKMRKDMKNNNVNPRDMKMQLAFALVKNVHGEKKATEAQSNFINTFQKKEIPKELSELKISSGTELADVLVLGKLASSRSDARRKIEQGGVSIDQKTEKDFQKSIINEHDNKVLKVGKKEFRCLRVD